MNVVFNSIAGYLRRSQKALNGSQPYWYANTTSTPLPSLIQPAVSYRSQIRASVSVRSRMAASRTGTPTAKAASAVRTGRADEQLTGRT